jgi:hypothetical protein
MACTNRESPSRETVGKYGYSDVLAVRKLLTSLSIASEFV